MLLFPDSDLFRTTLQFCFTHIVFFFAQTHVPFFVSSFPLYENWLPYSRSSGCTLTIYVGSFREYGAWRRTWGWNSTCRVCQTYWKRSWCGSTVFLCNGALSLSIFKRRCFHCLRISGWSHKFGNLMKFYLHSFSCWPTYLSQITHVCRFFRNDTHTESSSRTGSDPLSRQSTSYLNFSQHNLQNGGTRRKLTSSASSWGTEICARTS